MRSAGGGEGGDVARIIFQDKLQLGLLLIASIEGMGKKWIKERYKTRKSWTKVCRLYTKRKRKKKIL